MALMQDIKTAMAKTEAAKKAANDAVGLYNAAVVEPR
jgi:hypothetical protein